MLTRIKIKDDSVIFNSEHISNPKVRKILEVTAEEWPWEIVLVITRGAEWVKGSKPNSRHMDNAAFDFRTRNLPPEIDRQALLDKIMNRLGSDYYGYYKRYKDKHSNVIEWFHVQLNRETKH